MRILFTGASSFTGAWFVRELSRAGHEVVATFRRRPADYGDALRRDRAAWAAEACTPAYGMSFGDDDFLALVRGGRWDLLAHHAADVTDYRSPDFDAVGAASRNTHRIGAVLAALREGGCRRVLLTGSYFESDEGAGSEGLPDFSPYALSKSLTARIFRFHAARAGMSLGKFVIPNPVGPREEPRFTSYLLRNWMGGKTPTCSSPAYVRDNVHVSLLALAYVRFAGGIDDSGRFTRLNPSGWPESQGAFALRVAQAMAPRLGRPCPVVLGHQVEFPEPRVRINTDLLVPESLGWDEQTAWDEYARFALQAYA